jgi:thymidylate kinase
MGSSPTSGNVILPTSRLIRYLKLRSQKGRVRQAGAGTGEAALLHDLKRRQVERGPLWMTARFLNRMAEILSRQLISWCYQVQGYLVVSDRHFLFDTATSESQSGAKKKKRSARLEHSLLSRLYPQPDLVIFLDAPPEILYARKAERPLEHLEWRRRVIQEQGKRKANFVRVDASQPLDKVLADVTQVVTEFCSSAHHPRGANGGVLASSEATGKNPLAGRRVGDAGAGPSKEDEGETGIEPKPG